MIEIMGHEFVLCHERCLLHSASDTLFISDAHFGKTNHFRKAGIPIPSQMVLEEFSKFTALLQKYQPKIVVFLGDLFHSSYNASVDIFRQIIDNEVGCRFYLVKGNHDIMRSQIYSSLGLKLHDKYVMDEIVFTHEPLDDEAVKYNIYGHIHPAITLKGDGKQYLRLPCFYFGINKGILPAYGLFTGLFTLTDFSEKDDIFVIAEDMVIKVR
jgi:uncharacterized protein